MTSQKLPRSRRRASIVRAAAAAFATRGYADTSMTDVAEQADVTRVLLYRHFDSKEALYRAVLDEVVNSLRSTWQLLELDGESSPMAAMQAHLNVARANPDGYRLLWHHADTEQSFAAYAQVIRATLEAIADERVGDAIKPELRPWAAAMLVSNIVEAVLTWLDQGDPLHDDLFVATSTQGITCLVDGWSNG